MREILFRGKRKDNGEWVYGCILHYGSGAGEHFYIVVGSMIPGFVKVISETVGQFIGLTDSNGAKIFEGDIVKTTVKITSGQADTVVHVFFSELCASFMLAGGILCSPEFMHKNRKYEIIGNIHDTPELLDRE
jgi:uncharacterized phage protein (TIGR01671 family)